MAVMVVNLSQVDDKVRPRETIRSGTRMPCMEGREAVETEEMWYVVRPTVM